ncbi:metal-dependent hydrolase [Mangrovactinospora gilvigrisea]|uniref:Metal-dependent hydrolase n=1 Tax=Mangrovactinospora gilvigrisea TaxID=1428644 RepID=A0A1J7C4R4_9ACTN|nr:metal-dependent hydrolase [Mangrovactinospora gilvigrisea]OIV36552.1 metal-dependent hydrolase [Mangrovactinospora gilvigrisea]
MSMLEVARSTQVTFPSGAVEGRSVLLGTAAAPGLPDGAVGALVAETPFHPLDHTWPDQPGDAGTLAGLPVDDCLTGAVGVDGALLVGAGIPAKRGEEGWHWVAVHVLAEADAARLPAPGTEVELRVDGARRAALSAAHTGCHLLAFALNGVLAEAGRWRKEARPDALGNPDFDGLAMQSSRMDEQASTDVYRLGKSLRKKGFSTDGLAEALPELEAAVNTRLAAWLATGAPVAVETDGPDLTALRRWTCPLPGGTASVLCGGTHLASLTELAGLATRLTLSDDATELTAVTTPTAAPTPAPAPPPTRA